jgi:hypothetical protein
MLLAGCSESLIPYDRFVAIVKDFAVKSDEFRYLCQDSSSGFSELADAPAKFNKTV